MHLVQFTYWSNLNGVRVCTGSQELKVEDMPGLEVEVDIENANLKIAQRYDEVEVSCASLDFCSTLK